MPRNKSFDELETLTKAMELFWKKGFHATSMQEVVDHLGINRASIYDTYGGKQELFNKAFELYLTTNNSRIISFLNAHDSVREALRELFQMHFKGSAKTCKKGCFVVNATAELLPGDKAIEKLLLKNKRAFEALLVDLLQKGVDSGEISAKKDLKALAALFFTLNNGMSVVAKVDPRPEKMEEMINAALAALN